MVKKFNEYLNESDLKGKRVRLVRMVDDPNPVEPGTEGTIEFVDGIGQLHVKWDNGRSLALIPEVDKYAILNEGCETTASPGSGTAVGGGAIGSFTPSAGVAVYGGDSGTAFATNSNASSVESIESAQQASVPRNPDGSYKKRKKTKDKKSRKYDQIGAEIDKLYTRKKKNETMITNWNEFNKLNEDDGGGSGTAAATLGNTGGMGAIVAAQPSSIPGSVWGADATKGSGDIGQPLGVYSKQPAGRKKRRKDKEEKVSSNPAIDNLYVTNYREKYNGNVIQNWQTFTDTY